MQQNRVIDVTKDILNNQSLQDAEDYLVEEYSILCNKIVQERQRIGKLEQQRKEIKHYWEILKQVRAEKGE